MEILVTGGRGFIGSNLVEKLILNKSNYVTVIDDDIVNQTYINKILSTNSNNIEFIFGDIRSTALSNITKTFDVIIHLAAVTNVRQSFKTIEAYNHVNINGLYSVLNFAVKSKTPKVIFTSSSSVYGTNTNYPWNEKDICFSPINPYAITKLMGEHIGFMYSYNYGIKFISLRLFNVFGPYMRDDLLIEKTYQSIINQTPLTVYGTGTQCRDFTYIDNVIYAIEKCFEYNQSDIFNIGTGTSRTVNSVVDTMCKILNKDIIKKYQYDTLGEVFKTEADISKAKDLLNYRIQTTFDEGLRNYINFKRLGD